MDKNLKEKTLFQGNLNYNSDKQHELLEQLIFFIKENGLTISQAKSLLKNAIESLDYYGTVITVEDYEKLTGKEFNS